MVLITTIQMKTGAVIGGFGLFYLTRAYWGIESLRFYLSREKQADMEQAELKKRLGGV